MKTTYLTFEQINENKRKTIILILALALILIGFCWLIGYLIEDVLLGLTVGLLISSVFFLISFATSRASMLAGTKGKEADAHILRELKILRMVENLAVSANIPTPKVYIIPTKVPNAFASGFSPKSAFIGVTEGLINTMEDEEILGVLAHEISHIANYDVRICMVGYAIVAIFAVFSTMGLRLRFQRVKGKTAIIFFIIVLCAFLARFIANLLNLAISRKREFIADAYAVRLCSNNMGLVGALRKLAKGENYSKQDVAELGGSHMLGMYINQKKAGFSALFSTHPPIEERIRILENMG
ncbi:MAG: M48 family metallopeptidase [Firmicutes bacterium]|nr:M48 family metallopeptidase [Bacillota bacterium]